MSPIKKILQYLIPICLFLAVCISLSVPLAKAQAQDPASPSAETSAVEIGQPTNQIIIQYRQSALAARAAVNSQTQMNRLSAAAQEDLTYSRAMAPELDAHVLRLPSSMLLAEVEALAARLEVLPEVEYAHPDYILQIADTPTDPLYPDQWHLFAPVIGNVGINLPAAWDITRGNPAIVTAVLDTGSLFGHPDLSGNFIPGYDMVRNVVSAGDGDGRDADPSDPGDYCAPEPSSWHGTHVAGTIGAGNPLVGGTGIAPNAYLQTVRVLGRCGGNSTDILEGILWAAGLPVPGVPTNTNPARVLNLSLSGPGNCPITYQNAIDIARARNVVVVVAAGNGNIDASGRTPANCSGVITVAAIDQNADRSIWSLADNSASNFGSTVEISAPGTDVLSTGNGGVEIPAGHNYVRKGGTSMATPHVAGIVALMLSVNPSLTPDQVLTYLQTYRSAFPAGSTCNTSICGTGIANAGLVLSAINTTPFYYLVNSLADDDDGLCERAPGDCTLREAIRTANGTAAADTIDFVVSGTITLNASLPTITQPVTIWGPDSGAIAIDGDSFYRVLEVEAGTTRLENITIQNGASPEGGGIYNTGTLWAVRVTFKDNSAINGGAIYNNGSTFIVNSTFSGNAATSAGGGILSANLLWVKNSTLSGNSAPIGAGFRSDGTLYLDNTIIANSNGPDCTNYGGFGGSNESNNLIESTGDEACGLVNGVDGNIIGIDPILGALASNGGPTQTMAPLSGSPAINAASNVECNHATVGGIDQTGKIRLPNGGTTCDIGAYEVWGTAVDTTRPDTTIDSYPANPTTSTSATFTFSGTDNVTLPENLTFYCYLDSGFWEPCTSPQTYDWLGTGEHDFWVWAVDEAGNVDSEAAGYNWTINVAADTTPPDTTIDSAPANPTSSTSATFTFSGTDDVTQPENLIFQCYLDSGPDWVACTSPHTYNGLSEGPHNFWVVAYDEAFNVDPSLAHHSWTIDTTTPDTTPPETTIDSYPANPTNNTQARFTFSGTDNDTQPENLTFECKLDQTDWYTCIGSQTFSLLPDGEHQFMVYAIDEAGIEGTAAIYSWVIDTIAPVVTLDAYPSNPSNTDSANFVFSTAGSATFECDLDGGGYAACTSPMNYTGLSNGSHTFSVIATDSVGINGTPTAYTWTVNVGSDTYWVYLSLISRNSP